MSEMLCFSQGWILGFVLGFIPTMAWSIVRLRQATALWHEAKTSWRAAAEAYYEARQLRNNVRYSVIHEGSNNVELRPMPNATMVPSGKRAP